MLAHLEPAWLVMRYALFVLLSAGIIVTPHVLLSNELKVVFLKDGSRDHPQGVALREGGNPRLSST
jgi:hypothetical protein